ncbi:MAG: DUF1194 domain-containing protein [Pseudomonadota bacterium]
MRLIAALFALLFASAPQAEEVDLELVLLVDVSRSMTPRELTIQRNGYAAALQSEEVYQAMRGGLLGRIALTYVEWSNTQTTVVPWTAVETRQDLAAFAAAMTVHFDPSLRRTSISEALLFGMGVLEANAFDGLRQVIDISGDGPNNLGPPVTQARQRVVGQGIVINGLPLMTREGMGAQWHLNGLDIYFQTCVIGGPGAFVVPVYEWADFPKAIKRKLVLEIAGLSLPPLPQRVQNEQRDPTDCLIGEKIWEEFSPYFMQP